MQITLLMNFAHLVLAFIVVVIIIIIYVIHLVFVVIIFTMYACGFLLFLSIIIVIIVKIYASCEKGFLIDGGTDDERQKGHDKSAVKWV